MNNIYNTLVSLFQAIANAIREKKGSNELIKADDFPQEIANLPSGGDPSEYFNTNPTAEELATPDYFLYRNYIKESSTPTITIPDSITNISYLCAANSGDYAIYYCPKIICNDNVTDMGHLYYQNGFQNIDVSGLNVLNVEKIGYMFAGTKLVELDLSNWNFTKISSNSTFYRNVFFNCNDLEKISTPKMNISSMYNWFQNCYSLKTLIITDGSKRYTYSQTFSNCYHMDGTVNATYNPQGLKDGRIYVPDALVDSYKSASGWSTYADQILPLSQYVEE